LDTISLREVTHDNWQETLALEVEPEQQRFVADSTPIAAIALAKAYIRPGGATWEPYAIYAGSTAVGFLELAYTPGSAEDYWLFHFFIDRRFQGRGYARDALARLVTLIKARFAGCVALQLVVHPENQRAQRLYRRAGFRETGVVRWGEPVFRLELRDPA
jgi:diamine N-acetyltransferase